MNIHSTSDPDKVLDMVKEKEIDCVVSDNKMPGKNGLELCKEVKEMFDISFILFTSQSDKELIDEAFRLGVDEYLKKGMGNSQYKVLAKRIQNVTKNKVKEKEFSKNQEIAQDSGRDALDNPLFLQNIIDRLPMAVFAKDSDGRIILANEYFGDVFGIDDLDSLLGSMPWESKLIEKSEIVDKVNRKVLEDEEEVMIPETQVEDKEGNKHFFEVKKIPFKLEESQEKFLLGVAVDVTDRKDREESLEEILSASSKMSEAKTKKEIADIAVETMESALGLTISSLHIYDEEDDVFTDLSISEGADNLFDNVTIGRENSLAGKAFEKDETRFYEDLEKAEDVNNPETPIRSEIIVPVGDYGLLMSGSRSKKDFSQTEIYSAKLLASITESSFRRADREEKLREREKDLENQNERLNQFANILSHDLRSPLNIAQGYLDIALDTKDEEDLKEVEKAHDRIENIIDSILTLAKHTKDVTKEHVDMEEVAKSSWKYADTDESATLKITENFTLETDKSKIRHILENLFSNSVQHSNGSVEVKIGSLEDGFFVEDDGPGIPEDKREDALDFGYSNEDSTGFGLSIVEQISKFLGFEINVTGSEEGGARFEFRSKKVIEE